MTNPKPAVFFGHGNPLNALQRNSSTLGFENDIREGDRSESRQETISGETSPREHGSMTYIVDYLSGGRYSSWWITREKRAR